ncbi:MAG: hypothetical protein PHE83_18185 [Opitutaceae bacterium]|nr:hypothetical protein [Opitutaceae bacterium]
MPPSQFGSTITWLGHCTQGTSDKLWGYLRYGGVCYTFWGKRLGPWTFKNIGDCPGLAESIRDQKRWSSGSRYLPVDPHYIYPGFLEQLENAFAKACLTARFHGSPSQPGRHNACR